MTSKEEVKQDIVQCEERGRCHDQESTDLSSLRAQWGLDTWILYESDIPLVMLDWNHEIGTLLGYVINCVVYIVLLIFAFYQECMP